MAGTRPPGSIIAAQLSPGATCQPVGRCPIAPDDIVAADHRIVTAQPILVISRFTVG
jgi:hypothetical protein